MDVWQLRRARRHASRQKGKSGATSAKRRTALNFEPLEERLLFSIAPTLGSVITSIPNDGDILNPAGTTVLNQAPQQLVLKFDNGQQIDPATLAASIQIVRSGGDGIFNNGNDVTVQTGYVGVPEETNKVVIRFLNTLPDDTYQISVTSALKNTAGQALSNPTTTKFAIDYGAQVSAVVPQPITRTAGGALQQSTNTIQVYFTNDKLVTASAQDPTLYQLIKTQGTATTNDDGAPINPQSVVYDPVTNMATLTFAQPLSSFGVGTYRLRIGDNATNGGTVAVNVASDAGSSFSTSTSIGTLSTQTKLLTNGSIDPPGTSATNGPYGVIYPGAASDPGQRDIPAEQHVGSPDSNPGIEVRAYNFRPDYGFDPQGNPLLNQITEQQKQDVRDILQLYGYYLGIKFVETPTQGFTVATGDPRANDPTIPVTSVGGIAGAGPYGTGLAIMNAYYDDGTSAYGSGYFTTAMHEIGHLLGLGHTYELPPGQIMGSTGGDTESGTQTSSAEPVFPGDFDIMDALYLHRNEGKDIDIYSFNLAQAGTLSAETIAQRLDTVSLLNTVLTLYDSTGTIIARNDNYFGNDSFLSLALPAGQYWIAVSSTGNTNFNPKVVDSGYGGTTEGAYDLRLNFSPIPPATQLLDLGGQALDGDLNGVAGGDFNFWFQVGNAGTTRFVDKTAAAGGNGTLATPYNTIQAAFNAANPGDIVRIVGNDPSKNDNDATLSTFSDDKAYEIGSDIFGNPLSDGASMNVPKGVTVMIDAGAIFKLRAADINAGSISQGIDLSGGAIQVLGTPKQSVYFTSYNNEGLAVDTNPLSTTPAPGDWGGLAFQNDSDHEAQGIFLNYVAHANISYGGGAVVVDSQQQVIDPIHLVTARPTVIFNNIHDNADAAISANPDAFEFSLIEGNDPTNTNNQLFTADYSRSGPLVYGNVLARDSINGLFIRIHTNAGSPIDKLTVTGRLTSTDIVYVLTENLFLNSGAGGPLLDDSFNIVDARLSASLIIDPGVVVKAQGSRIEVGLGANLIAEGTSAKPIIFTSLNDDSFGAGGVFDTTGDGATSLPQLGDWSGFYFWGSSFGSIEHAVISYGGGTSPIEGGFAAFNAVEIYQATVRIADSILEHNAEGADGSNRNGRAKTGAATIYVLGAQPVLVNNIIRKNAGDAISINANSLNSNIVPDWGRSTGPIARFTQFDDNYGPLVRLNILDSNDINAMEVRSAILTTTSIWDDVDIVHLLQGAIDVPNFESMGGLTLKSSPTASLVVKLNGPSAGFTADGAPLDITNRIGGSVRILGMPGHAVILTALQDGSVGAGYDLAGNLQSNTLGNGLQSVTTASQMTIQFRFDASVPLAAQQAMLVAAQAWTTVLNDPITLTFDIKWGALSGPLGVTSSVSASLDYNDVRSKMIANIQPNDTFLNTLPTFAQMQNQVLLPTGGTLSSKMRVNRADALALGFTPAQLPTVVSSIDGATPIDGTITFNSGSSFDFDRSDGLSGTDFIAVAIHEIGHGLGFVSGVDSVDGGATNVSMTPLDMFRMAPGDGAKGFNTAQRIMVPGPAGSQVFYDGGVFDHASLQPPNSSVGDIPLSTGETNGDGWQASHWESRNYLSASNAEVGIMDPQVFSNGVVTQADLRAFELMGYDAVNRASAGAWNGITLAQYSNDRNVALINEYEPSYTNGTSTNSTTQSAQSLGQLAKDQLNADENSRIGFEVHGSIALDTPGDTDVYSFTGTAGTPVWLDIMNTSPALDTVVELIDANGNVLARSNNSVSETANPALLVGSATVTPQPIQATQVSNINGDLYSKNLKDAGMRLILPGTIGGTNTYYVRVRSNSTNLNNLTGGLTSGNYVLQVRLQEQVEVPGSTVQFADIRYATNAVTIQGLPGASPTTGTATSNSTSGGLISNTTFNTAQDLGNLLSNDQNLLSVSGTLTDGLGQQVQWYKFTLDYDNIQVISGSSDGGKTWATIFDVDFADGLARPDITLSVFDSLGNLLFVSRGSNVPDDQTPPGNGQSALTSGSGGKLDPFLGTIQLPEGTSKTYYVAISSDAAIPKDLDQTFVSSPTNKLIRLEPVNSKQLIVNDHLDSQGYLTSDALTVVSPSQGPVLPIADLTVPNPKSQFTNTVQQLSLNIVPYTLADLNLFVSTGGTGGAEGLYVVNSASGASTRMGNLGGGRDGVDDIVMRNDGTLLGVQGQDASATERKDTAGRLVAVDPVTGALYAIGRDNIPDLANPPQNPLGGDVLTASQIDALTYDGNASLNGAVDADGNYTLYYSVRGNGPGPADSYLYIGNNRDGHANIDPNGSVGGPAGGDQLGSEIYYQSSHDVGYTTGMAFVNASGVALTVPAGSALSDGQTFTIKDAYHTATFEFDSDGSVTAGNIAVPFTSTDTDAMVAQTIVNVISGVNGLNGVTQDGAVKLAKLNANIVAGIENANAATGLTTTVPNVVLISNIEVSDITLGSTNPPALLVDPAANAGYALYGVSDTGMLYTISTSATGGGLAGPPLQMVDPVSGALLRFSGLALGPQNIDFNGDGIGGDLANTLFAITTSGDVYAIDPLTGAVRLDLFFNQLGAPVTHLQTGLGGASGLAFQSVDFNLWHPTNQDGKDQGHGLSDAPDGSRWVKYESALPAGNEYGYTSYYFGLENYNKDTADPTKMTYLPYTQNTSTGPAQAINAQFGVLNAQTQLNLTANTLSSTTIAQAFQVGGGTLIDHALNGYDGSDGSSGINVPGTAHGSLITNSFSLANSSVYDLPTLYFNYYLQAQNASGNNLLNPVHVYVSTDNGTTWTMVATNNSQLNYELPNYLSPYYNTGNADPRQVVQQLFNNVSTADQTWRQARIDLSQFAGAPDVKLMFQVDETVKAGVNYNYRGFGIDDIVVGNTGQGEMVTQMYTANPPAASTDFFESPRHAFLPRVPTQSLVGAYELTIRRGQEYSDPLSGTTTPNSTTSPSLIYQSFSETTRGSQSFSLMAPGAFALTLPSPMTIVDGDTLTVSDGVNTRIFEFKVYDPNTGALTSTTAGNIGIPVLGTEDVTVLAQSIATAINHQFDSFAFNVKASLNANRTAVYMVVSGTPQTLATVSSSNAGLVYAPQIFDGNVFTLSDGARSRTFEWDSNGSVASGNIAVPFTANDSPSVVALSLLTAINSQYGVSSYNVRATSVATQVNLFGAVALNPSGITLNLLPTLPGAAFDPLNPFSTGIATGLSYTIPFANGLPVDGTSFTLNVHLVGGMVSQTFTLVKNGSFANLGEIPFFNGDTVAQITNRIINVINLVYFGDPVSFPISASGDRMNNQVNLTVDNVSGLLAGLPFETTGSSIATITTSGTTSMYNYRFENRGDTNPIRPQGEVIIANNTITSPSEFGISVEPGNRDSTGAHPGSVTNMIVLNSSRLTPGPVIMNNIIDSAGVGGIHFSGDPEDPNEPEALVPFGRIINNTIYGAGKGVGIEVQNNASPTILNNILAYLQSGITVDGSSSSTVIGANLYQGNTSNTAGISIGSFGIVQSTAAPLFVNAANHNFNLLKSNSSGLTNQAIDSSLNSLQDRTTVTSVNSPLGIGPSPILAPAIDATGKVRVDDPTVNPPLSGLGSNVFKDRGALDRSDFLGPSAAIINPLDNSAGDQDANANSVLWAGALLPNFQIQLSDGTGSGVDDSTVSAARFTLTRDGVTLVSGVDYTFSYDATNHIAVFTPQSGIWSSNHTYVITVDNSAATGIKDLAANPLQPTDGTGVTKFTVALQQLDFGSAPAPYPTTVAQNGARHIISGLFLGSSVTPSSDGSPNVNADNGQVGDGVTFTTPLIPGQSATVTVNASQAGKLDAWIDFNGDGDWDDAGEQIFTGTAVAAGNNQLNFNVPLTATTTTYARFRLSSAGGLTPTGLAPDGEVEDYKVSIAPTAAYTVVLADPTTHNPLPKDASGHYVVLAGATFEAQVYVSDTRSVGAAGGVQQAFASLTRDLSSVTWVSGTLLVDGGFGSSTSGTVSSTVVTNAGGARNNTPTGSGVQELLFTVDGLVSQATAPGTIVTIAAQAATGGTHTTTVFGSSTAVAGSYGSVQLAVPTHPWQNPISAFDVNNDGFINILDVVKVVGELNSGFGGPSGALSTSPVAPNIPPPYLDVNGDNFFNVLDIIAEVAYINAHGFGPVPTQPSPAVAFSASSSSMDLSESEAPASIPLASAAVAPASTSSAAVATTSVDDSEVTPAPLAETVSLAAMPVTTSSVSTASASTSTMAEASASATTATATPAAISTTSTAATDSIFSATGLSVGMIGPQKIAATSLANAVALEPALPLSDSARGRLFAAHYDDAASLDLEEFDPALSTSLIGPPMSARRRSPK